MKFYPVRHHIQHYYWEILTRASGWDVYCLLVLGRGWFCEDFGGGGPSPNSAISDMYCNTQVGSDMTLWLKAKIIYVHKVLLTSLSILALSTCDCCTNWVMPRNESPGLENITNSYYFNRVPCTIYWWHKGWWWQQHITYVHIYIIELQSNNLHCVGPVISVLY